jgi:uncharacterized Zn finger protein
MKAESVALKEDFMAKSESRGEHTGKKKRSRAAGSAKGTPANWDDKIEKHLRAKSQGELADLVWSLTRRFPELYQEFRERIALQEGDVDRLIEEARDEIREVTSEPAWRDHWNDEGHTPDYSRIQHRFERLLELGHADEVVSLGREFIEQGLLQVNGSHDQGETATAFAECLPVVFQAVTCSSLSGPEKLLFAIDTAEASDHDVIGDASVAILDATWKPEDWSAVADTLAGRLTTAPSGEEADRGSFSRDFQRDGITSWIAKALREAGRAEELRMLYESEARVTGSYQRLVNYLLETRCFDDAERWAREGITATRVKYPGVANQLAQSLCELARKREQWDVVAAHAARPFFEQPSLSTFDELMKAAGKAGVEGPVRDAALRFLETGVAPFKVIAPPRAAATARQTTSWVKKQLAATRPAASSPEPKAPVRLKIDPAWPLPMPDYFVALLSPPNRYDPGPHPHLEVLLDMAIAANRPDDVLHWFDTMLSRQKSPGAHNRPLNYSDRVAAAVSAAHPERAIEIYLAALSALLPIAEYSAYENATGYLKKLRPIYEALDRTSEWTALLASIREKYRNRPRFMVLLDNLDGQTKKGVRHL